MKKGLIFATTLAMALGVGVAVGAHQEKAAKVEAATNSVTLAGSFNSWSATAEPLTLDGDYWTIEKTLAQDDEFKVVVNGSDWVGDGAGVHWCSGMGSVSGSGSNFKVLTAGTYIIKAAKTIGDYDDKSYGVYFEIPKETPEYHLVGDFNSWTAAASNLLTVDPDDANHYSITGVEMEKDDELKIHDTANDEWFDNGAGNIVVSEDGTYDVDFYVHVEYGDRIVLTKQVTPEPTHTYKYYLNGDETGVAMTQSEDPKKQTEYESASLSFKVGDTLTFKKDDAAYAVSPKEDGAFTRVFDNAGVLTFAQAYEGKLYLETNGALLWAGQFEDGYYLFGTFNGWNPKLGRPAVLEGGVGPAYVVSGLTVAKDDEVEMISFPAEGKELSYHEADPNRVSTMTDVDFTVITGDVQEKGNIHFNKAGTYTIYFNPEAEAGLGWYSIEDDNYVEPVYTVQVGATEYDLELNEGTEYKIKDHIDIKLNAGDEITVLKDGVEVEFERKKIGNNNLNADFEVIADAQAQVYIDLDAETIFAGGLTFGGYHLLVNNTFVQMTKNDNPMEGYDEYYSNMISFKKDDVIRFIDTNATLGNNYAVVFDIANINSYSEPGVAVVGEGAAARLVAQQNVNLAVYLKLSMILGDEVYFGNVPEEVALAKQFAENFNDAMEAVCVYYNKDIDPSAGLVTAWGLQVAAFEALDEKAQTVLKNAEADDSIKEIGDFIAKYEYIAGKYGDKLGEDYDFLAKGIVPNVRYYNGFDATTTGDNTTMIIIIAVAATSALAFGALLLIKKRKHN